MSLCLYANNSGAALSANGNYCAIQTWSPPNPQTGGAGCSLITNVTYKIVNATATGTLTFQSLGGDGTWRNMATPAAISLSNATTDGTLAGAYHGVRVVLSSLAVSTVTYVELCGLVNG